MAAYYSGQTTAKSPGAARWELNAARRGVRGERYGAGNPLASATVSRTVAEFDALKQFAIESVRSSGGGPQREIEAINKAVAPLVRRMARYSNLYEVGIGAQGYPYAKPRGQGAQSQAGAPAPGPQPQGQMYFDLRGGTPSVGPQAQAADNVITLQEIQEIARRSGKSPEKVRADAIAEGLIVR